MDIFYIERASPLEEMYQLIPIPFSVPALEWRKNQSVTHAKQNCL